MNAFLLFKDKTIKPVSIDEHLKEDLEMGIIIENMADSDSFIKETACTVFSSENRCRSAEAILYRQDILKDCIRHSVQIRNLYQTLTRSVRNDKDTFLSITRKKAKYMLDAAVRVMLLMQAPLKEIRSIADRMTPLCRSEGLNRLFKGLTVLFSPENLSGMEALIKELSSQKGITAAASMGKYLRAQDYHPFRTSETMQKGLFRFLHKEKSIMEFDVDMNDPEASPALSGLRDDMALTSASIVVQAKNELFDFLKELRSELSFYIGCLNLKDHIEGLGMPVCIPAVSRQEETHGTVFFSCTDLYNISLSFLEQIIPVPGSVACTDPRMIMITGSNQGGKTTFLRSLGQALLMMNSGMFTAASGFVASPGGIFSHFIREEDKALKSGRLDEELLRMSEIVSHIRPGDWLLLNESFASTNEEEGSEIALEIITALYDQGIHIVYVTHFYHLIQLLKTQRSDSVMYLNALRDASGVRTYRLKAGEPVVRGYGEDLYQEIFH